MDMSNAAILRGLHHQIKGVAKQDALYEILSPWECGAFDGGCLMVADALRHVLKYGAIHTLWGYPEHRRDLQPANQHAVLCIGDLFVDGDGVSTRGTVRRRWTTVERTVILDIRPLPVLQQMVDQGTPYNLDVVHRLAELYAKAVNVAYVSEVAQNMAQPVCDLLHLDTL